MHIKYINKKVNSYTYDFLNRFYFGPPLCCAPSDCNIIKLATKQKSSDKSISSLLVFCCSTHPTFNSQVEEKTYSNIRKINSGKHCKKCSCENQNRTITFLTFII